MSGMKIHLYVCVMFDLISRKKGQKKKRELLVSVGAAAGEGKSVNANLTVQKFIIFHSHYCYFFFLQMLFIVVAVLFFFKQL